MVQLIKPSTKIESIHGYPLDKIEEMGFEEFELLICEALEGYARTCYQSFGSIEEGSARKLMKHILGREHLGVLEHVLITVRFIINRGGTHELVRMRIASYLQESTRYCGYYKGKFGGITVIDPFYFEEGTPEREEWMRAMEDAERHYMNLTKLGVSAEKARGVLPIDTKADIIATMNMRQWRYVCALRTTDYCHPQMLQVMRPLLDQFKEILPLFFNDINYEE